MSTEQIAREFVSYMANTNKNSDKVKSLVTPDATASGGALPHPMPLTEAMQVANALTTAFPDLKFDVQNVTVNGNQATVKVLWGGTNTGPLNLPGMPAVPPTGKKVSVKDAYVVTVQGDKVSHFEITSPADGGIPAALAQIGVKAPAM
jgi:predicted ester cyclase